MPGDQANVLCGGGQTISADAPLETMPLYVRSGLIIPIGPEIQFTGDQPDAPIELWVYPGQDGDFTLYEDEGDNYNYENGYFASIELNWVDESHCLVIGERHGSFPGMKTTLKLAICLAGKHQV